MELFNNICDSLKTAAYKLIDNEQKKNDNDVNSIQEREENVHEMTDNKNNIRNTSIVYVLRLESEKYYVGITTDLEKRLLHHIDDNGSVWTGKYTPIECIYSKENPSVLDEDLKTKELMLEYGI
jgi:predicted GIY-YIG superfamily endonuclease